MKHERPNPNKIPGFYEPDVNFQLNTAPVKYYGVQIIPQFLSQSDIQKLTNLFDSAPVREGVSVHGLIDVESKIGSHRTTMWSENLAEQLNLKLEGFKHKLSIKADRFTRSDTWQDCPEEATWNCVEFSPLFRFMEYKKGGHHYPHYDAGFFYDRDTTRTLVSVVIYLTTNESGATRLIADKQDAVPQSMRLNEDWSRSARCNEIIFSNLPQAGSALLFPHRICHDVGIFEGESRKIIRGDLIYRRHIDDR